MDELQDFPPWILDSLVNVWKALWSSRVLSAIIIRDFSYECWLKKITVTFHSFFFFLLLNSLETGFPQKQNGRIRCADTERWWCSPDVSTLRMERKGKTGQGPPSASVAHNQIYGAGLPPGHFSSYRKEKKLFAHILAICSASLLQVFWSKVTELSSDTQKVMDVLYVSIPTSQPCTDAFHAPGHLTWH